MTSTDQILEWLAETNRRTHGVLEDLDEEQQIGPQMAIVNPPRWEVGHVGWFMEKWVLRHALGRDTILRDSDSFYDSIAIAHTTRWVLDLPPWRAAFQYLDDVRDAVAEALGSDPDNEDLRYHARYAIFHQDMHNEAFAYTRQTLGYPPPPCLLVLDDDTLQQIQGVRQDQEFLGGTIDLGARKGDGFVFDNEKWAHEVAYDAFAIACSPVTQAEFAAFVDDGGYKRPELWDAKGREWLAMTEAQHPVYWRRAGDRWERRIYDRWFDLERDLPVVHVNWHEANAYCAWAGRRLPTEVEWEVAATTDGVKRSPEKRRYPWGDEHPQAKHANLDWRQGGCVPIWAYPLGRSAGCRQLLGNVWEWTSTTFRPYPGFQPDPYKEFSEPWFETRKVLRGGAWCTMSRMLHSTVRNFYEPDRRDVWAGFRTCAAR